MPSSNNPPPLEVARCGVTVTFKCGCFVEFRAKDPVSHSPKVCIACNKHENDDVATAGLQHLRTLDQNDVEKGFWMAVESAMAQPCEPKMPATAFGEGL